MLRWFAVLALLFLPGAQACSSASGFLDLDFPRAPGCGRMDPRACPALPEADFPYVVEGTLTWGWESDACSVLVPSAMPVHIHLDASLREATGWLDLTVEPREILIPPQEQWDVTDDEVDPNGSFRAQEQFPVRVTVALVGEPSLEALERVQSRNGLAQVALKASADSTDAFGALFTWQDVFFDGSPLVPEDAASQRAAPSASPLLALAVLALAVAFRRRA